MAIKHGNLNIGIVEHMALVLCAAIHTKRDDAARIFSTIMASEYRLYMATFLLNLLNNAQLVGVKTKVLNKEAMAKNKKIEGNVQCYLKLTAGSVSYSAQEYLKSFEDLSPHSKDPSTEAICSDAAENARDRLLSGAIYLIGVNSIFDDNIVE